MARRNTVQEVLKLSKCSSVSADRGYGIGTHIFDFGLFASFANWKYPEIGCKFTFELFNR